ncbi:MAG: HAD family hydrolase [Verrucomicrobiales bacterium]|nr:HAD family hydrolase [Verrucomicrobiae bacterium]MCP5552698.1 HAD family hydrolase [Akkermansiaceae bacterium]
MKLLLWDIDGTLLDTGGAGMKALREGWQEAFPEVSAITAFPPLDLAGSTDAGLARLLFDHYQLPWSDQGFARLLETYHLRLEVGLRSQPGRVLPGVADLLARLGGSGHFAQGLLTGNTRTGAATKTRRHGLDGHFAFGAFGDDHHDRNALGPIAIGRAEQITGHRFEAHRVYVIGDTPRDIACARACGAVAIAVATGRHTRGELEACFPDWLFDDLSDGAAFIAALHAE